MVVTAVSKTGRKRTRPARKAASLAPYPRFRYSLKVSISTMLLFTTMPASAMTPSPLMTMPKGWAVAHRPSMTPPVDSRIADMVTKACHAELNCTISTISISSNDSEKAWLRNAPVSAISSFSPAKETSTSCTSGAAASEA